MDFERAEDQVRRFLAKEIGEREANADLDSRLEEDFGVSGIEADDFAFALIRTFQLYPAEIDIGKHFAAEALWHHKEYGCYYPITIRHLIAVVQAGYWFDPPKRPAPKRRFLNFWRKPT